MRNIFVRARPRWDRTLRTCFRVECKTATASARARTRTVNANTNVTLTIHFPGPKCLCKQGTKNVFNGCRSKASSLQEISSALPLSYPHPLRDKFCSSSKYQVHKYKMHYFVHLYPTTSNLTRL